jgi:hypothetical protein
MKSVKKFSGKISDNLGERWFKNGLLHREVGPAIIWSDGEKEWWLNNEEFTREEWLERLSEKSKLKGIFSTDKI